MITGTPRGRLEQDDVVEGCRRGDADSQHRLFTMHKDRVYSLARLLCRDPADAVEITQDVFVKVFSGIEAFRGESKFETWLYRIVHNTARDHSRKSRRLLSLDSAFWKRQPQRTASAGRPEAHSDMEDRVRSAIASLPKRLRTPIVLRYMEDLSYEEIAAVLRSPPGTIAARLSRAHRILALKLTALKGKR
jgi:RNA polymerase sigma-70 factor (ECF subfamily)